MQQGYGFLGILVRNRVLILSILVSERVWLLYFSNTGNYETDLKRGIDLRVMALNRVLKCAQVINRVGKIADFGHN